MTRPVVLLDTGPLVAALSRNDHAHAWAKSQFAALPAPFLTCEPVISEACFLLRQHRGGASGVLALVESGALRSPDGSLPTNSDGGGLCNNHPGARGGMPKMIEAVRQLRGEATPEVQVRDCRIALVNGIGGSIGTRMGSGTLVLGSEAV